MAKRQELLVLLTLRFQQEDEVWVGVCEELSTSTFHKDLERAYEELIELVALHLNGLEDIGERDRFFKEHGIRALKTVPDWQDVGMPVKRIPRTPSARHRRQPRGCFSERVAIGV